MICTYYKDGISWLTSCRASLSEGEGSTRQGVTVINILKPFLSLIRIDKGNSEYSITPCSFDDDNKGYMCYDSSTNCFYLFVELKYKKSITVTPCLIGSASLFI
jgi:hypothetical protein